MSSLSYGTRCAFLSIHAIDSCFWHDFTCPNVTVSKLGVRSKDLCCKMLCLTSHASSSISSIRDDSPITSTIRCHHGKIFVSLIIKWNVSVLETARMMPNTCKSARPGAFPPMNSRFPTAHERTGLNGTGGSHSIEEE